MLEAKKIAPAKKGKGLRCSISRDAVMNAVESEGPGVLRKEGAGYWRDMERRYPWLNAGGCATDTGNSPNGHKCRLGPVTRRARWSNGKLIRERWEGGKWVEWQGDGMARLRRELAG